MCVCVRACVRACVMCVHLCVHFFLSKKDIGYNDKLYCVLENQPPPDYHFLHLFVFSFTQTKIMLQVSQPLLESESSKFVCT